MAEASLAEQLEEAIQAGVTVVQLREKELDFDAFVSLGKELQAVAKCHRIPFIINDAVDVALAWTDSVHGAERYAGRRCPQPDRRRENPGCLCHSVEEALAAERNGADYLGVGAIYGTATKPDANTLSIRRRCSRSQAVSIPVVGIGGIAEGYPQS